MYRVFPRMIAGAEHFVFDVATEAERLAPVARFQNVNEAVARAEALNGEVA